MTMQPLRLADFAAVLCVACIAPVALPSHGAIFKCAEPSTGKVKYQDAPCEEGVAQSTVRPPPPAPAQPAPARQPQPGKSKTMTPQQAADAEAAALGAKQAYEQFIDALQRRDRDAAFDALTPDYRRRFEPIYQALFESGKPLDASTLGVPRGISIIGDSLAEMKVSRRSADGTEKGFSILMMRDRNGKWYIDGM